MREEPSYIINIDGCIVCELPQVLQGAMIKLTSNRIWKTRSLCCCDILAESYNIYENEVATNSN